MTHALCTVDLDTLRNYIASLPLGIRHYTPPTSSDIILLDETCRPAYTSEELRSFKEVFEEHLGRLTVHTTEPHVDETICNLCLQPPGWCACNIATQ